MVQISRTNDLEACLDIRRAVFIRGQNVPEEIEIDGEDGDCIQYLVTVENTPAATARVKSLGSTAKIQRVAVLESQQGTGLGAKLMRFILDDIRTEFETVVLGSQMHAIGFYEKLGFVAFGPEYDDANIPHREMTLSFNKAPR
ncbi:GNAT family N-acetyltransferase [uncultured Litoreibacter sp.]|uniref:GNAT family N-acetyltransferase n=1 Tax=uncultured Litoreibacter sp. TaxID=1392394 RepID=UPI0026357B8E|nr:GNAT family N-acetyltransferase [uncultured Litoreibacter sp.]